MKRKVSYFVLIPSGMIIEYPILGAKNLREDAWIRRLVLDLYLTLSPAFREHETMVNKSSPKVDYHG